MKKTIVSAPAAGTPVGPYSQAVVIGDLIFVSAEKGIDPDTGQPAPGGIAGQTRQALMNIEEILKAAGSSLHDVVRCVVYAVQGEDFGALNAAYGEYFPEAAPARSTVFAASLPLGLLVLIEATAVRGCGK